MAVIPISTIEFLKEQSRICVTFLIATLPSLTKEMVWCYELWPSFNNCQKGKLVMQQQLMLNVLLRWFRVCAISPISIVHASNGGQSWSCEPSTPFLLLLRDESLVLWAKVSTRVSGSGGQTGCFWY